MSIARRARSAGALQTGPVLHWSTSGRHRHPCRNPLLRSFLKAAKRGPVWDTRKGDDAVAGIAVYVRCRTCPACFEQRRAEWVARTLREQAACPGRVWFVTLTSSPQHREYVRHQATALAFRDRVVLSQVDAQRAYPWLARAYKREISLFLKRLRLGVGKEHNPKLRFLAVREPHDDWVPHAHLLLFEWDPDHAITKRLIEARWGHRGFSQPRLCHGKAVLYVSKYLGKKGGHALPHASLRWGSPPEGGQAGGASPVRAFLPPSQA